MLTLKNRPALVALLVLASMFLGAVAEAQGGRYTRRDRTWKGAGTAGCSPSPT